MTKQEKAIVDAARKLLQAARDHDGDKAPAWESSADVYEIIFEELEPLFEVLDGVAG